MAEKKVNAPILNDIERESAVWKKIKAHLEQRLAKMRQQNDRSVSTDRTEKLRGRIAELKYLAALDNPTPQTEADDVFPD